MVADNQDPVHNVRIFMLNGERVNGFLIAFSPRKNHFSIQTDRGQMQYIDVPEVSCIGFFKTERRGSVPKPHAAEEYVIHTLNNNSFRVLISDTKAYHHGMFAFPEQDDSPFTHFFFYNHGIHLLEHTRALGEIMVKTHKISEEDVKKALSKQIDLRKQPLGDLLVEHRKVDPGDLSKVLDNHKTKRKHLGTILVESKLITEEDLQNALEIQRKNRSLKVGEILISMGVVTEVQVTSALAEKFHLTFVDLDSYAMKESAVDEVAIHILQQAECFPIDSDEYTLTLARSDPRDIEAFDNIRFQVKKRIVEVLATPSQINKLLAQEVSISSGEDNEFLWIERIKEKEKPEDELTEAIGAEASPIVRLTNNILVHGIRKKASDIHILPQAKKLRILFRINGDLIEEELLEKWVQRKVVSRIKLLSGMDIAEHRLTQDGRMNVYHENNKVEFRVSCIPNIFGESIVLRILNKDNAVDLETLGLREQDQHILARMIKKPLDLILATGPTGSGKSTTLFSLLKKITTYPLHVITVEDPVESEIEGANQIQINQAIGLTFSQVLRNIFRHDPDVIMVGEIRDSETASISIESALTGHLMLSTLHTNSAVDTIIRLKDLGIPNYLLAPALRGIISQNLLKKLCPNCCQPLLNNNHEIYGVLHDLDLNIPEKLYQPQGCELCNHSGFSGRIMVYEFLIVTETIRDAIHDNITGNALQKLAIQEGMQPIAQHALELAGQGIIGHEDLIKVLI